MKKPVTLSLDEKLIASIDSKRGQKSRSSYVESVLRSESPEMWLAPRIHSSAPVDRPFRCKVASCTRRYGSSKAICDLHGCKAIPA